MECTVFLIEFNWSTVFVSNNVEQLVLYTQKSHIFNIYCLFKFYKTLWDLYGKQFISITCIWLDRFKENNYFTSNE